MEFKYGIYQFAFVQSYFVDVPRLQIFYSPFLNYTICRQIYKHIYTHTHTRTRYALPTT